MTPTADQIAHAVVAASRFYGVDPIKVMRQTHAGTGGIERSRALIYAMMAIADLWGNDMMASRLVGMTSTRAGTTRRQLARRALKWWDPKVLELVKAAIPDPPASPPVRPARAGAPDLPAPRESASLPAVRKAAPLPARKIVPNYGTIGGMGPPRPHSASRDLIGEKAALRNQLAEAVRNTAKLPSQN